MCIAHSILEVWSPGVGVVHKTGSLKCTQGYCDFPLAKLDYKSKLANSKEAKKDANFATGSCGILAPFKALQLFKLTK